MFFVVIILTLTHCTGVDDQSKVDVLGVPNNGLQPKVKVDQTGQVHLLYYKGSPQSGDLFYIRKLKNGEFSDPLEVNSIPGSAVSIGTIRGAQFAIDEDNYVHVAWNGSMTTKPDSLSGPAMYYTRLSENKKEFEPQRIISGEWPVDGGGAIAADKQGNIYVFWHSATPGSEEKDRTVFLRMSHNDGKDFREEKIISPTDIGVCGCCAMQAESDSEGNIYVVYRTATKNKNRDINLLVSNDSGKTFQDKILDRWELNACPMSSMSFGELEKSMLIGWETEQQVRMTLIAKGTVNSGQIISPTGDSKGSKHPVFATSPKGNVLISWTEGTGWEQGGSVAWLEYDADMNPVSETGRLPAGVSVWSFVASYYDRNDNTFYIFH